MKNENIDSFFLEYLKGELDTEKKEIVENYINENPETNGYLDFLRLTIAETQTEELHQPPEMLKVNFYEMLEEEVEKGKKKQNWLFNINQWLGDFSQYGMIKKLGYNAFIMVMGVLIGYVLKPGSQENNPGQLKEIMAEVNSLKKSVMIAQINHQSPAERIKGVSLVNNISEINNDIIFTLGEKLKNDENLHVKMAAANALYNLKNHSTAKNEIIEALGMSSDPYVQLMLIKMIADWDKQKAKIKAKEMFEDENTNQQVKTILKQFI